MSELSLKRSDVLIVDKYIKCNIPVKHRFLNCGHEYDVAPSQVLSGSGCGVCHGLVCIEGINDLYTTRPDLVKYFVNVDDSKHITSNSGKRVSLKCPIDGCNYQKEGRVADLSWYGFSCPIHDDGVSYPEKIMWNILEQLNIDFVYDKTTEWSGSKRYDFRLDQYKVIIEMNGLQHYSNGFVGLGGRTLREEQENDDLKLKMANQHEIDLIAINCSNTNFEYIKNNIINSRISSYFDLSTINWEEVAQYACSSLIEKAAELWDDGLSICEIAVKILVDPNTVKNYLVSAAQANICNYTKDESRIRGNKLTSGKNNKKSRSVCLCSTNGIPLIIWESRLQAAKELDINVECIRLNCIGKIYHAGNLLWKNLDDVIMTNNFSQEFLNGIARCKFSKDEVEIIIKNNKFYNASVVCFDDSLNIIGVWDCPKSAEREIGVCRTHIIDSCYGKSKRAGGYLWLYAYDKVYHGSNVLGAISKGIITEDRVREKTIQN